MRGNRIRHDSLGACPRHPVTCVVTEAHVTRLHYPRHDQRRRMSDLTLYQAVRSYSTKD